MQTLQQRILIDTGRSALGEPAGRIFNYSENTDHVPKLEVNFPKALVRDVNGADQTMSSGMFLKAWTGIPNIVEIGNVMGQSGHTNCNSWSRFANNALAVVGTVGLTNAGAFANDSPVVAECSSVTLRYY